jgi:predicted transcriptional regulator
MRSGSMLAYTPRVSLRHPRRGQDSATKRRRVDIVADVLDVAVEGAKKTRIMRSANLSHDLLKKYLEDAVGLGLLRANDGSYETTEKGREFLKLYAQFLSRYSRLQKDLEPLWSELESLEKMCSPPIKNLLAPSDSHEKKAELKDLQESYSETQ